MAFGELSPEWRLDCLWPLHCALATSVFVQATDTPTRLLYIGRSEPYRAVRRRRVQIRMR